MWLTHVVDKCTSAQQYCACSHIQAKVKRIMSDLCVVAQVCLKAEALNDRQVRLHSEDRRAGPWQILCSTTDKNTAQHTCTSATSQPKKSHVAIHKAQQTACAHDDIDFHMQGE